MSLRRLLPSLAGSLLSYASVVEPRWFQLTDLELVLPRWPAALDGCTLVQLSDFHARRYGHVEQHVAALAAQLPTPDLLCLTGDFAESDRALDACRAALEPWPSRLGTFAVLGNNDYIPHHKLTRLRALFGELGIRLLEDEALVLGPADGRFALGGLRYYFVRRSSARFGYPVEAAFAGVPPHLPRVLLSHSPEAMPEAARAGVDLMLSGHTHGGQVCLPGGRPLIHNLSRPEALGYLRGLHQRGVTRLYVNRGLGVSTVPMRFWSRPEVLRLTLRCGSDTERS